MLRETTLLVLTQNIDILAILPYNHIYKLLRKKKIWSMRRIIEIICMKFQHIPE